MEATYNSVVILGVVSDSPALRYEDSGTPIAEFTLSTRKNRDETLKRPVTVHVRIRAERRLAELCAQFLVKGRQALVVGELSLARSKGRLQVLAREVKFLKKERISDAV